MKCDLSGAARSALIAYTKECQEKVDTVILSDKS